MSTQSLKTIATLQTAGDLEPANAPEHPRFQIPFRLNIAGRSYEGAGISLTEITAVGLADRQLIGPQNAHIVFAFNGCDVGVNAAVEVLSVSNETGGIAMAFSDPLGPQRHTLRSIFNAYIAGEYTPVPGLIGGGAPKTPVNRIAAKPGLARRTLRGLTQTLRTATVLGLGVLLAAFAGSRIYDRVFVTKPKGVSYVATDAIAMNAPKNGTLAFANIAAKRGEPLFAVKGADGTVTAVDMPCDCAVIGQPPMTGASVSTGKTLLELMPRSAPIYVVAFVDGRGLETLSGGAQITTTVLGGEPVSASLSGTPRVDVGAADEPHAIRVVLATARALTAADVGKPVDVTIDRFDAWRSAVAARFGAHWGRV